MSIRAIQMALRAAISVVYAIDRYPEKAERDANRARKKEEREERKQLKIAEEREAAEQRRQFEWLIKREQEALSIEADRLKISQTELSDALGYYKYHKHLDLAEAPRRYRMLLATGKRMPASSELCSRYGRRLRREMGSLTEIDRVYLAVDDAKDDARRKLGVAVVLLILPLICVWNLYDAMQGQNPDVVFALLMILVLLFLIPFSKWRVSAYLKQRALALSLEREVNAR
jgi:hypothetical protein